MPERVNGNEVTFKHRNIDGELKIKADTIILAVGQKVNTEGLGFVTEHGEVKFKGYKAKDEKVYVTGDIAEGDKTVVWAVRKGKEVAEEIDHDLLGGN